MPPTILTFVSCYLPGFKAGGPLQSIANLVDHLGDEFTFRIVTSDRDTGDTRPYPGTRPGAWRPGGQGAGVCDHDGWGVVVSEALMADVPAIWSDACEAAAAVNASGVGGVFPNGDVEALFGLICKLMNEGPYRNDKRRKLAEWAKCLSSPNGAVYLNNIINYCYNGGEKPLPRWGSKLQ